MVTGLLKKKEKTLKEKLTESIKEILKENMKINYMIVPRRTLQTSEKFFINIYTDFIINLYSWTDEELLNMKSYLNANKTNFIFSKELSEDILLKCFNVSFVGFEFEKFWENNVEDENKDFDSIMKDIKKRYESFNVAITDKIKNEAYYLYKFDDYKRSEFYLKDTFVLIKDGEMYYIYTTRMDLNLANIRTFSFFVKWKKNYKVIVVSNEFFSKKKKEIEDYRNTRVYWLSEIKNPFLLTYLCNNMTNLDFWDLNITYFYADEMNPHKVNCSVRHKRKYKIINFENISDFDINVLDWDIITLGWKLSWVVTVTNVKVWRFTYRVLIVRKNWIYFLNFRKVEWIPYDIEELEDKSWVDVKEYIIDEENTNSKVWFDVNRQLKHFDIDFPLGYQEQDIDMVFSKLVSSTKWTFWINWKTNSWKSTSLKNILLKFYEFYRQKWENKNILMIENPIEWYDYYLKQIEVDDEDIEDYKAIIMWIKRADLDMCLFWELRTYDVFGVFNEVANSLPVVSTFHVWTAESFLSMLEYYSNKADLNWKDVFGAVNTSIVQIPLMTEKAPWEECIYYHPDEEEELLNEIFSRFRLNSDDLTEEEQEMKRLYWSLIKKAFKKWLTPLKSYSEKAKPQLYYEILTWDMLGLFLNKRESEFSNIYKYLWYSNNILYKSFVGFLEWYLTFDNVKIDEYSFESRIATLEKISEYLDSFEDKN